MSLFFCLLSEDGEIGVVAAPPDISQPTLIFGGMRNVCFLVVVGKLVITKVLRDKSYYIGKRVNG